MYTLIHNPKCSKSRQALQLLQDAGIEFTVRNYLDEPLTRAELVALQRKLGSTPSQWIRWDEPAAQFFDADDPEHLLVHALAEHPELLQRPILIGEDRAMVGRPDPDVLLQMLSLHHAA